VPPIGQPTHHHGAAGVGVVRGQVRRLHQQVVILDRAVPVVVQVLSPVVAVGLVPDDPAVDTTPVLCDDALHKGAPVVGRAGPGLVQAGGHGGIVILRIARGPRWRGGQDAHGGPYGRG